MKKTLLFLLILIGALPAFSQTPQVTFTATPNSQTVDLGNTFNVTFSATTTVPFGQFDLYLGTTSADAGLFTVTNASLDPQFAYVFGPDFTLPTNLETTSAPGLDFGLASTVSDTNLPAGGPYTLTTLTIQADNGLSPGDHTLTILTASAIADISDSPTYNLSTPVTFTIDIVPEPGTASLLLAGLLGCLLLSPRVRRVLRASAARS